MAKAEYVCVYDVCMMLYALCVYVYVKRREKTTFEAFAERRTSIREDFLYAARKFLNKREIEN